MREAVPFFELPPPREPRFRLALAPLLGLLALVGAAGATYCVATGSWSRVVAFAWVRPGVELRSIAFVSYLLVCACFVAGGAFVFFRPHAGLMCTGAGFLAFAAAAQLVSTGPVDDPNDWILLLIFFVLPAYAYFRGAARARRALLA